MIIFLGCVFIGAVIAVAVIVRRDLEWQEELTRQVAALEAQADDPQAFEAPEHQTEAWTPLEREAFGVNETIKLIDRIDAELGQEVKRDQARRAGLVGPAPTTPTPRIPDEDYEVIELCQWGDPTPIRTARRLTGGIL